MNPAGPGPARIGETLDRAISVYVRHFVPLFAILAIVTVPVAIVQALTQPDLSSLIREVGQSAALPAGDVAGRARLARELGATGPASAWSALIILLSAVFSPLAATALIRFVSAVVAGAPLTVGAAYRGALARWLPQLVVGVAFVGLTFVVTFAIGLAAVLLFVVVALIAAGSKGAAAIVGVVIFLGVGLVFAIVAAPIYLAWQQAAVSIAIEETNPVRAIGNGLRRTFDRRWFRRSLLVALAIGAISVISGIAFLTVGALFEVVFHVGPLAVLIASLGQIATQGLVLVFVVLYARDVRIRREGVDLLFAAGDAPQPT